MGWMIISFINIDLYNDSKNIPQKVITKIKNILREACALNVSVDKATIYCELNCNKEVDYSPVDKIKELRLSNKLKFSINASEYVETGDNGYYFDTEDEEN